MSWFTRTTERVYDISRRARWLWGSKLSHFVRCWCSSLLHVVLPGSVHLTEPSGGHEGPGFLCRWRGSRGVRWSESHSAVRRVLMQALYNVHPFYPSKSSRDTEHKVLWVIFWRPEEVWNNVTISLKKGTNASGLWMDRQSNYPFSANVKSLHKWSHGINCRETLQQFLTLQNKKKNPGEAVITTGNLLWPVFKNSLFSRCWVMFMTI